MKEKKLQFGKWRTGRSIDQFCIKISGGSKSIQPLAAYNIKNAINELQYEPNMFARNLKRGQTQIVGLIVPHMEYFFGKICHVVSDYFFERKILLISVKVTVSGKRAVLCPGASEPESRRNHNCTEWAEYTISAGRNKEL